MKIPFGSRKPTEKESSQLTRLGFDLDKMEKGVKYYYLEIPSNPKMQCKIDNLRFNCTVTAVSYNGVEVISIKQQTAIYDSYVYFNINEKEIDKALTKSLSGAKGKIVIKKTDKSPSLEEKKEDKNTQLTKFQKNLADRLSVIEFIVFDGGAETGHGSVLGEQLPCLQALRKENPEEDDKLMNSSDRYKELITMFPEWTDKYNLQPAYEAKNAAKLGTLEQDNDGHEQCKMM